MNILIYGWYNNDYNKIKHNNAGDELFKDTFTSLFPKHNLTFTDKLNKDNTQNYDAVFLGGGSFLDQASSISPIAYLTPAFYNPKQPIFYIGVGAETDIHPTHQYLLKRAKHIFLRSSINKEKVEEINPNVSLIPDLIFQQMDKCKPVKNKKEKSVLILPNVACLPQNHEPHWKHMGWEYFKFEMAQFLDDLIGEGYKISFLPFCSSDALNDEWAAVEIMGKMKNRSQSFLLPPVLPHSELLSFISEHSHTITQRFHGAILSQMAGLPCLSIAHHDKLLHAPASQTISFYGANKKTLKEKFDTISPLPLSIEPNIFREMAVLVEKKLNEVRGS
jgi:polysaccharide pyruvyl transferase WcaK-like protein